jgi:ribose transport system substrate-binding protein
MKRDRVLGRTVQAVRRAFQGRKALSLAAISFAVVAIAGVANASGVSQQKTIRIAHLTSVVQNSYFQVLYNKEKAIAKKNNATIQLFDANFDANKQVAQCQDALASGKFDAFIILPVDNAAVVPCVKSAIAKGIKVVSHNFPLGPSFSTAKPQIKGQSGVVMRVTTLDGKARGDMVVQACRGINPCEVALIEGDLGITYGQVRMKATENVLKSHSNIKVVTRQEGGWVRADSLKVTQDTLQAHPGLDVVATGGDQGALGAEQAVKSAGKKVGTRAGMVRIVGVGTSTPGIAAVKAGRWWGTTTWVPFIEGSLSATLAIKAVRGQLKKPVGVDEAVYSKLPQYYSKTTMKKFPKSFVGQWPG